MRAFRRAAGILVLALAGVTPQPYASPIGTFTGPTSVTLPEDGLAHDVFYTVTNTSGAAFLVGGFGKIVHTGHLGDIITDDGAIAPATCSYLQGAILADGQSCTLLIRFHMGGAETETDGHSAVQTLTVSARTVNFGVVTDIPAAPTTLTITEPSLSAAPVGGVYWNKDESGSGFGLDYQNGTLLVEVYSYLAGGESQWYLAAGPVTNHIFTATLDKYTGGQCISCAYKAPSPSGNDGTITITFTSATTATADLPGGRHIPIERYFGAPAAPGQSGSFTPLAGVWWNKDESGSGFGLDYQDGTLTVEVYSYLASGGSQWYLAAGPITNNVFTATLYKYAGGQCISCAYVAPTLAGNDGTITITFTSATTATVDLPGRHFQIQRYFQ